MNTLIPRNEISTLSGTPASSGRRLLNAGIAAALAGIVSFASIGHAQENSAAATSAATSAPVSTAAKAGAEHHQHHRHFRHGAMDPAHAEKRIEHRIDRMLTSVNASAEQKTRVTAIAKAAFNDLRPLQEKSRANRAEQFKLLTQAKIDTAALEKLRLEKLQLADQRSQRINKAFIDAAAVLTPAQRVELATHMKERMQKRHERRMEHGHKKGEASAPGQPAQTQAPK
jgi:Spy/CpxP family protein refolding chaperone